METRGERGKKYKSLVKTFIQREHGIKFTHCLLKFCFLSDLFYQLITSPPNKTDLEPVLKFPIHFESMAEYLMPDKIITAIEIWTGKVHAHVLNSTQLF